MKVFIGGSRKISRLNDIIRTRLYNIINQGFTVLVGDANGADKAVQKYLYENKYSNVSVFCSGNKCRNNVGKWFTANIEAPSSAKGIKFYMIKDAKMSEEADYGFMLWDGKSAGTLNNILNLLKQNKTVLLYFSENRKFYTISKPDDLKNILSFCEKENLLKFDNKISLSKKINELTAPQQLKLQL